MNKENDLPFISCKCITYGRVDLLEEAIESFLRQDYPEDKCELIIVNDYPLQTLIYNNPRITIINYDTTFETIGDKENFATEYCKGDIICQFDDDDIALPNHLQNVAKYFTDEINLLHWGKGAYWNEPEITSLPFIGNSGIVFRKSAWKTVGGHPKENAGYDMTFVNSLHRLGGVVFASPEDQDVSWFYRWGFLTKTCYHQSGQGTDTEANPNILVRHAAHIESLRRQGLIPEGIVNLKPNWMYNYSDQLKNYLKLH